MNIKVVANYGKKIIEQYIKDGKFRRNNRYSNYYENYKIEDNYILYETRDGKSMTCNPYAIFKYLLESPDYKNYIHIWSIKDLKNNKHLIKSYKNHKNVRFVSRNSREYIKYLAKSRYLINNTSFPDFFQAKPEQIYINTWHGTPLKYMGRDIPGPPTQLKNILRNFLHTKYILSPNPHTTEIFLNAYQLKNVYSGEILEEGYPRNDLTLNLDKTNFKIKLNQLGIKADKKIILYAPTWKGTNVHKPKNEVEDLVNDIREIQKNINQEEYTVLIKVHPFIYKYIQNVDEVRDVCIPDYIDTNELLGIVDILITDYSSIFFDFLITNKPILFYMKDEKEYEEERGLYLRNTELPGPVAYNVETLSQYINNIVDVKKEFNHRYELMRKRFCAKDDGKVTERIVSKIFGNILNTCKTIDNNQCEKQKLLIYGGGFFNNGITVSLISLLDNIDYDRYDVTVFTGDTRDTRKLNNINKLDSRVRIIFRPGTFNITVIERVREKFILHKGLYTNLQKKIYPKKAYAREYRRIFGNSEFDCVIDYSGYSMFWDSIILESKAKKKIIYLHNNMKEEFYKKDKGRYVHKMNLTGIFSIYDKFDMLISVTESCREANIEGLAKVTQARKHYYLNNPISYNKILTLSKNYKKLILDGNEYFISKDDNHKIKKNLELIKTPLKENINFVNIGRLSEEKGQSKLIKAFKSVIDKYDNARLYIMGEGSLEKELKSLIAELGLSDRVYLIGQLNNPYYVLDKCDCFVLSSNHEGQGLVVLESMTLRIPVISTDIPGPRSLLEGGYGDLVENNAEALTEAMVNFIENGSIHKEFNYIEYNNQVMKKFYKLLGED